MAELQRWQAGQLFSPGKIQLISTRTNPQTVEKKGC